MSLEKITLDFKGIKIHLKPVRHGVIIFDAPDHSIESPNQYVETFNVLRTDYLFKKEN